jgi:hypothetical protein
MLRLLARAAALGIMAMLAGGPAFADPPLWALLDVAVQGEGSSERDRTPASGGDRVRDSRAGGHVPAAIRAFEPSPPPRSGEPRSAKAGDTEPGEEEAKNLSDRICEAVGTAAGTNGLPIAFFARLIWQESRFNPRALSRAGARGIAQFMPGTANWRGLADPFEPITALYESAQYLRELREQFGNLGLAAAAYNAGPGRVQEWLAGRGRLPRETLDYVRIITGHPVEEWRAAPPPEARTWAIPEGVPCSEIVAAFTAPIPRLRGKATTAWAPWGVQLLAQPSEGKARIEFERLRRRFPLLRDHEPMVVRARIPGRGLALWTQIRVPAATRERAERLCFELKAAGGACIVMRTPGAEQAQPKQSFRNASERR